MLNLNEEQQAFVQRINAEHGHKAGALPFYLLTKGDSPQGAMDLGTYVNPKLSLHSDYFGSLEKVMKCVEKNASAPEDAAVCQKEFKELRLAAFDEKLLYHQVNQQYFMKQLSYKSHQSPY